MLLNYHIIIRMIAAELGINKDSIQTILKKDLNHSCALALGAYCV